MKPSGDSGGAPPIRIAYLILAHADPDQLARLVGTLPADSSVLIHFDLRAPRRLYEQCQAILGHRANLKFVKRATCRWGAWGIVQGTINLIEGLLEDNAQFDYATLISGADYPIKSNSAIARYLSERRGSEFIESFPLMRPNRWSNQGGYFKSPERMLCRHLHFRSRVLRIPGIRKLPAGLEPYGGAMWWSLSREALEFIRKFIHRTPEFVAFSKQSFIPDESFFQTILSNSYLADRVAQDDLRFVLWDRPTPPYPATLNSGDLPALLESNKLCARKFNSASSEAVMRALDAYRAEDEAALTLMKNR